jgi:DNA primase
VSRYTDDSRDRVRDAVDMVALVSARTELRRAGVDSYFGLCPFHDERTPSFHVRPDEKHYHCFGCQASGDPFDFLMETEGLDFKGALESLADRFGVKLEREAEDPEAASRRQRRERLYSLLGRAATYYARYLWEAREAASARSYLLGRGLAEETLREFGVGYAPSAWGRMLMASRTAGFSDEELLAVGLVQRSKNSPDQVYDRFRERIMFPASDARGRVHGFGARAMRDNQQPKYLNTSEGEIYSKRTQLFGIDHARGPAARAGRMILVEGYTDVLALHQAGIRNAVGIMGTSLTEEQVGELARIVSVLELCLDADRAGHEAMLRASRIASGRNPPLELRVVALPDGVDPAELVERQGADAIRQRVEASVPFVVFHVERILDRSPLGSAEGRDRAAAELGPILAELPPSALREDLMRRVAGRLELSEGQLASLLSDVPRRQPAGEVPTRASRAIANPAVRAERTFLVYCIALPEAGARALAALDPDEYLTSEPLRRAARHLAGQTSMPLSGMDSDDEELARIVAELVELAGRAGDVTEEQLDQQRLLLELARLDRAIRRARADGGGDVLTLAREREEVQRAIRGLDARLEAPV